MGHKMPVLRGRVIYGQWFIQKKQGCTFMRMKIEQILGSHVILSHSEAFTWEERS
jgi:hypothetical protein